MRLVKRFFRGLIETSVATSFVSGYDSSVFWPDRAFCPALTCSRLIAVLILVNIVAVRGLAQEALPDDALPDGGIPVTSELVNRVCGSCHRSDEQGRMSRISYQRTTPEGWQQTLRRMVLLNGLEVEPEDAREIVRYLATSHGLAPEEAMAGAFHVERRNIDFSYEADPETQQTCNRCHSMGRVLNQRRTREEWELLVAMHRGLYPFSDFQSSLSNPWSDSSAGRNTQAGDSRDTRMPFERAVDHLAETFPLDTPEWTNWSANMRRPRLEGRWVLVGREHGQGPVYGEVIVTASETNLETFTTRATYTYPARDVEVNRNGQSIVYAGFQWRGRSSSSDQFGAREVMFVTRSRDEMSGRWFSGAYDERGIDVRLQRIGTDPVVTGVYPRAVPREAGDIELELYGANLQRAFGAEIVDLGPGLTVMRISEQSSNQVTLHVVVDPDTPLGSRDLLVGPIVLPEAVAVFDDVHRLELSPATGLARVGGVAMPKQYERFEARAYHHGVDGEPNTDDDLDLGMVDVDWALEEYAVTYDDDDIAFIGGIDETGVFTPADDGPNPERSGNRNNIGDVWVVGTLSVTPGGVELLEQMRARAHLVVTVPLYIRRGGETRP